MTFRRIWSRSPAWFKRRRWLDERLEELRNEPRPWYATGSIYRFWTADCSVLLYLGKNEGDEPTDRMKGHVEKSWLAKAGCCNREWVTGHVRTAEAIRIRYENPRHNVQRPNPRAYGYFDQSLRSYRTMLTRRLKNDELNRTPEADYWHRVARMHPMLVIIGRPSRPDRDRQPDLAVLADGDPEGPSEAEAHNRAGMRGGLQVLP